MPYVPDPGEARALRRAIERARLSEGERVFWLTAFLLVILAGAILATMGTRRGVPGLLTAAGVVGFLFSLFVLYWRLRSPHQAPGGPDEDRELHSLGLASRRQRAFTALMLRQALTGRNPLGPHTEHDPFATWTARVERAQPPEDASSA